MPCPCTGCTMKLAMRSNTVRGLERDLLTGTRGVADNRRPGPVIGSNLDVVISPDSDVTTRVRGKHTGTHETNGRQLTGGRDARTCRGREQGRPTFNRDGKQ